MGTSVAVEQVKYTGLQNWLMALPAWGKLLVNSHTVFTFGIFPLGIGLKSEIESYKLFSGISFIHGRCAISHSLPLVLANRQELWGTWEVIIEVIYTA